MWGLLGLLGLVLVLVTGALIYVTTPPGEARIRAFAVEQANKQLMGRLELGGLDLSILSVTLTGVKLYDPEGVLVVDVGEVRARVDLLPLLHKQVVVRDAHLIQPHLSLHQDDKGLNLSRAIASRTPSEPKKPEDNTPGTLRFDLEDFHLEGGAVAFVSEGTDGTQREVSLEELNASATGSWASATEALAAQLDANAHLSRPLAGPVHLSLKAQGEKSKLGASVDFGAPGLVLEASGGTEGDKQMHAEVKQLSLAPELGRALLPSYPLASKVGLEGTLAQTGDLVKLALRAQTAGGTAEAEGAVDIAKFHTDEFIARVRGVDLAKLLGGGPSSSIAADLTVRGGGKSLETLAGTLDLTMPPSPIAGQTLGPVELHASAKAGHFTLSRLQAQAPGLELEASGAGTQQDVRLQGRLQAPNLSTFANTVGRLGSGQPLPLSGKGDLHFTVQGAVSHPAITLDGGFDTLAWADTKLQALWIELRLPDATKPLTSDALLKVKKLMAGGRSYDNLKASLNTQGREITASVSTTGRMSLSFALRALVDKDNEGLALKDLSLHYPDDGWTMQAPTHVSWGHGRTVIDPILTLTSGPQQLALALKMEGPRIAATADLKAFDLSRLPKPFLPDSMKNLAGHMSGHVQVNGRLPTPDAQVSLKLEGGRYDKYANLGFDLEGRYLRDRATGTFAAQAPAGRVSSKFNVPVQGLLRHRREPVDLELTVDQLDLAQAQRMAGQAETLTGIISGAASLHGMANDPRLKLDLKGSQLRYWAPGQPPPVVLAQGALPGDLQNQQVLGFALTAQSDDKDATLSATLDLQGLGSKATAHVETPFTLGRLLAQTPSAQQFLNTPMRKLQAQVEDLSLAVLPQYGLANEASGTVSMKADLTGPLLAPVGELTLKAKKATVNGIIPIDADGQLVTTASAVKLQLKAEHDRAPLAQLEATVNASLAALQDQDVAGRVPFTLAFKAGPISQRELMGLAQAAPGAVSSMCGNTEFQVVQAATEGDPQNILTMDLKARGTLDAPKVDLTAGVQNIGVSQVGLGQAQLQYTYDAAHSHFTVQLTSPKGGTLVAQGSLVQDLSLPAVRRGLNTDRAPLVVDVEAHQFDLSFLSGSQLPMVRTIGGDLLMDKVHVDGTLGAPTLRGKVEWKDGRLALDGLGDYRDVHLALEVNDQTLTLSDFSAKSAGGKMQLKAQAKRGGSGRFALTGEGNLEDFPLVMDDQLIAFLQLRTQFEGEVSENLVNLRNLSIPEAHVKLPDAKRKDLQPLDRPEGIVLVCQGKPLKPEAKPAPADAESGTGGAGTDKPAPQRKYWITINAPRNLWINGSDVNTELGLGDGFRVEYGDALAITGQVNVIRGDVSVLGRRFNVQNTSQVRFTGPVATPYINATAEYDNEKAGVKVYVAIRGQGKDFSIKPTSDPPLPETDIYTLLATGRRTLKAGSGQSSMNQGQVASVLGSLLASQARKALASKLPLDVLTIEAGDQGLQDAHLEVGKYLTDSLYLGYSGRLGTPQNQSATRRENANAVRLEYQFTRRWGLQAEYGDQQQGGADLIWSQEY